MGFVLMIAVVWAAAMVGWYFSTRYVKTADVDKIKARLTGTTKAKAVKPKEKTAFSVFRSEGQTGSQIAEALVRKLNLAPRLKILLEQGGLKWAPSRLLHLALVGAAAGTVAAWLFLPMVALVPLGTAIGGYAPFGYAIHCRGSRLKAFEAIFPDALEFISRSMRAGHAFAMALDMLKSEFPEPLSGEFKRTFEEHNLGIPLDVALQKLGQRVPSIDVHFFVSAVMLQKRTGGNLAEILDKLAYIIRERFKLRGRIKAVSAHGRMTAIALSSVPIGVGFLMLWLNADYQFFFFHELTGQLLLGAAVALQLAGYAVMNQIVKIEV